MARNPFTRRDFLRFAGLTTAAAGVGSITVHCDDNGVTDGDTDTGGDTEGTDTSTSSDTTTGGGTDTTGGSDTTGTDGTDGTGDTGTEGNPIDGLTEAATDYPVIIIGSGFGGAIAAHRLTEKGIKCAIIERGKRWTINLDKPRATQPFAANLTPDGRAAWLSEKSVAPVGPRLPVDKYVGLLERVPGENMDVYAGAAWGGGSVTYGNVTLASPRKVFEGDFGDLIPYDEMEQTYYPRVVKNLGASNVPDDVYAIPGFDYARSLESAAKKAGFETVKCASATDWDVLRKEIKGELFKDNLKGQLIYGNNSGSKLSLDRNYLKWAEETGKLDVFVLHRVTEIGRDSERRYTVTMEQIDEKGNVLDTKTMTSKYLFVTAGVNGTVNLLMRAREEGTLPDLSADIGKGFGNNGDTMVMRDQLPFDLGAEQAGPPVVYLSHPEGPDGPVFMEAAQFPSGTECNCAMHLGLARNTARGEYVYDKETKTAKLKWPADGNKEARTAIINVINKLLEAEGGRIAEKTIWMQGILDNFTYHPLGGAEMGKVCDTRGRVKGYEGLYVVDAALLPGACGCVNPSLTIAAITERCMDDLLPKDFGV
jgi:cholesterol oxidase